MLSEAELTGQVRTHVVQHDELRCALAPRALEAFLGLRRAAAQAGFDLRPLSSFRDLPAQLRIWNHKFRGERPLVGPQGREVPRASLDDLGAVHAILAWSALPGASRHHWGTDVDVYDAARVPDRAAVQLLPEESEPGGVFHDLHRWLDGALGRHGFFRPYAVYRGGLNPEPWHLSFAELAEPSLAALTVQVLDRTLAPLAMDGKEIVRAILPELHARYVKNEGAGQSIGPPARI